MYFNNDRKRHIAPLPNPAPGKDNSRHFFSFHSNGKSSLEARVSKIIAKNDCHPRLELCVPASNGHAVRSFLSGCHGATAFDKFIPREGWPGQVVDGIKSETSERCERDRWGHEAPAADISFPRLSLYIFTGKGTQNAKTRLLHPKER